MIAIRGVVVNVTCRHMSAHAGTYQHTSACPNLLTHASLQDKFQMVGIRSAESGFTCSHMPAHVGTYQQMPACPQILTHASIQKRTE